MKNREHERVVESSIYALELLTWFSVLFSIIYDRLRKPPAAKRLPDAGRLLLETEAVRPQTKPEKFKSVSEAIQLRTVSQTISIRTEFVRQGTMSEADKLQTELKGPPPSEPFFLGNYLFQGLMYRCHSA